ncbi:hypothetical protein QE152_g33793 [Popillia japonica]|uniref:Uncharacterized protein n=1 Tax=Popillia japonica TaxID=7064 RepID=A0AAW1IW54_POPJA
MWHILHFIFEESVNLLLKKMRMKEYIRVRLKHSVWYLGFYITSFFYCTATLYKNNIDIFSHSKLLGIEKETVPGYLILGFIVLCTFYAHSIIWEGLKKGLSISSASYLFLTMFILLTYFCRKVEISLSLLAIISLSQFGIELARCISTLLKQDSQIAKFLLKIILWAAISLFVLTHIVIVPLFFLFPLGYSFIIEIKSTSLLLLNITLWLWFSSELLNNPLYKYIYHWIYHDLETPKTKCPGSAAECSLFQPRDDVAFNLKIIREEIKDREAKMMSLRKPKSRSMLMQTLKCMVVIKKKLKEKKSASESSDSEESESDLQTPLKEKNSDSEEDISELDDDKIGLLAKNNNEENKVVINDELKDDLDDCNSNQGHSKVNME